jgi:hypothetical protein
MKVKIEIKIKDSNCRTDKEGMMILEVDSFQRMMTVFLAII